MMFFNKDMVYNLKSWPVLFGLGFVGLCFYLFVLSIVMGDFIVIGSDNLKESGIDATGMVVFIYSTTIIFLPSLFLLLLGWHGRKKDKYLQKIANMLDLQRNININKLSQKFDKPEEEIELDIYECINEGLIQGFIEPGSKKFIVTNIPESAIKHKNM